MSSGASHHVPTLPPFPSYSSLRTPSIIAQSFFPPRSFSSCHSFLYPSILVISSALLSLQFRPTLTSFPSFITVPSHSLNPLPILTLSFALHSFHPQQSSATSHPSIHTPYSLSPSSPHPSTPIQSFPLPISTLLHIA